MSDILHSPYFHTAAGLFLLYVAPLLARLVFHPSPTSRWGGVLARLVKLGLDPQAFEEEEVRIVKALVDANAKSSNAIKKDIAQ